MSTVTPASSFAPWSSVVETTAAAPRDDARLEQEAAELAAIVDLVERVALAPDLATAVHTAAEQFLEHLQCQRVAIGILRRTTESGRTPRLRLTAMSGIADHDAAAPLARAFDDCLGEVLLGGAITIWPPHDAADGANLPAHRTLAAAADAGAMIGVPLVCDGEPAVGACLLLFPAPDVQVDRKLRFLQASAGPMAAVLGIARRAERGFCLRTAKHLWGERIVPRRNLLLPLVVAAIVILFLPVSYRLGCQCQMQPVARRVVAAPFAGTLDKSLVKPGDIVRRSQTLGRMDGREIRWELAGLVADQNRAAKAHDVSMADDKVAAAQIDALEMQRLELKRRLLADRAEHLEIKSPIDGVVISGDLQRAQGAPVAVGQSLYEIAPLDRMVAEIAIPDDEIAHTKVGQTVVISFDAYPGKTWSGHVASIQPRSETRDNDNVFIAEVNLDNVEQTLRPGMKGRAKIETDSHPLGWIALHKPWERFAAWFGW